jgi:hypothetical protein
MDKEKSAVVDHIERLWKHIDDLEKRIKTLEDLVKPSEFEIVKNQLAGYKGFDVSRLPI